MEGSRASAASGRGVLATCAAAAATGGLQLLAFPPADQAAAGWVALVPLLLVCRLSGPGAAFLAAFGAALIFQGGLIGWSMHAGVHPFAFAAAVPFFSLFAGAFGPVAWLVYRRVPGWSPVALPSAWVVLEWTRVHAGWAASPWGLLGYSQHDVLPVARLASLAGVYGVSFLLVAGNAFAAEWIAQLAGHRAAQPSRQRVLVQRASLTLVAFALLGWLGSRPAGSAAHERPSLRVAIVQGGASAAARRRGEPQPPWFSVYRGLTLQAARQDPRPDLIVWPETAIVAGRRSAMAGVALGELARESGSWLLIGTSGRSKFLGPKSSAEASRAGAANSALLYSPLGLQRGRYDKMRLLPFNEYVPLRGRVSWPWWVTSDFADAKPGTRSTLFEVDGLRFGVRICWENFFPGDFRQLVLEGADFMVSLTSEAFTSNAAAHHLFFASNVFRAIENGVAVVRVATTGVSAIIAPDGRILRHVADPEGRDVEVLGFAAADLPVGAGPTLYTRFGDWLVALSAVALAAVLLLGWLRPAGPQGTR